MKYRCKKCGCEAECDYDDECEGTNLCYRCFEDGVEEAEERRLRRIQEANEY